MPLFERTRQGVTPTPAGEVLVERTRRALHELERAQAEIRPDPDELGGIVSVGMLESGIDAVVQACRWGRGALSGHRAADPHRVLRPPAAVARRR